MGTPSQTALEPYRRLPASEFRAFEAWLSTFYDFQLAWLLDPARRAIANKARQIGISHTTAALAMVWAAMHGELTTIVSKGQDESDEVLEYARRHARVLRGLGSEMARTTKDNTGELAFVSGGRVLALPSSGARGFSGNVVLDEFAYHEHTGKVWDASAAATTLGYRIRVISTPNGAGNDFADLWERAQDPSTGWSPHEIALQRAIDEGYPVDLKECWELAKGDPRLFDQLYNCQFLDTELQYIPTELLGAAFKVPWTAGDGVNFAGLDIGETRDKTVLVVLRRRRSSLRLIHVESHSYTDDELIQSLAAKAFGPAFGCSRLAVDATGLGRFPAKTLRKRYGRRLERVDFTLGSKEDLATGLYDVLAKENLSLPESYLFKDKDEIPELRKDIYAIRRIVTSAGNVRYDAARTKRGHADRAWALMLAAHAASRMNAMAAALQ